MTFELGGKTVMLKGDPTLSKALVSLKSLVKTIQQEGEGMLIELCQIAAAEIAQSEEVNPAVEEVLNEFQDVFQMPPGLPHQRTHDHAVVLKEGTEPVNVRPYRYP